MALLLAGSGSTEFPQGGAGLPRRPTRFRHYFFLRGAFLPLSVFFIA